MSKQIMLEVITPSKLFYKGKVEMVVVTTTKGEEGFMADHSWACKLLSDGGMRIFEGDGKPALKAFITGGYIDVKEGIVVYTDAAEWAQDIDTERAADAKHRAADFLAENKKLPKDDPNVMLAEHTIRKSDLRIHIAEKAKEQDKRI